MSDSDWDKPFNRVVQERDEAQALLADMKAQRDRAEGHAKTAIETAHRTLTELEKMAAERDECAVEVVAAEDKITELMKVIQLAHDALIQKLLTYSFEKTQKAVDALKPFVAK